MRAIPMLFALAVGGVCYADAMGWIAGPSSLMHPKSRPHVHKVEIDLTDAPKGDVELKPAVVDTNIEWVADLNRATLTGDTETEEEKRLFWHTEWGANEGVPFMGWGDPDPLLYPVLTATHSPDNPGFHFIEDPAPPRFVDNPPGSTGPISIRGAPAFETVIDDATSIGKHGEITDPIVRKHHRHHHQVDDPIISPIDPVLPGMPGGQTSPIGAVATPEPSTWFMVGIGFVCLALVGRRKRARLVS